MTRRDGSKHRPWSASTLARLAWPENPNYGSHDAPWARTVLGTALHEYLERRYSPAGLPEESLADLYHAAVAAQGEVRYGREQTADTILQTGSEILTACLDHLDSYADGVQACEASFLLELDGQHYDGTVDLVCRVGDALYLFDYKTGGKFDTALYVGNAHPQPHLYSVAALHASRWATGTRYIRYHELDWSESTPIPPYWEWPTFTYLHLTPQGVVPIPAITSWAHSPRASVALLREYTQAARAAILATERS